MEWWGLSMKTEIYGRKAIKASRPMCCGLEDATYAVLDCGEIAGWKMMFKCKELLNYHTGFIINEIINCNNRFLFCQLYWKLLVQMEEARGGRKWF
jgi:hypothetical protein